MDTIYALASAHGRAGVSVLRISGPNAFDIAARLMSSVPSVRGVRKLYDSSGAVLDQALVLRFEKGHSFTGEAVIELHVHGSVAIVSAVLEQLSTLGGRMAEAGEFTRRALENGRLDLAQVEGLADLIDAETEAQRKQAMAVFGGALGHLAEDWRRKLIRAGALIEATIDFVDEDVPVDVYPEVLGLLGQVSVSMQHQIAGAGAAERIRTGFEVAIVGRPNVGKSTLLNRLAGRSAAITSDIAGTTRDVIEVRMDLGGLAVTLLDTAGIRETTDVVEGLGVALAQNRAKAADLRLFLVEDGEKPPFEPTGEDLVLKAKVDSGANGISGLTGNGIDAMVLLVAEILSRRTAGAGFAIRTRHRDAMSRGVTDIAAANDLILTSGPPDLIAEDLRAATRAVDMIVGRVDVEDLLDEIFLSFCIGK